MGATPSMTPPPQRYMRIVYLQQVPLQQSPLRETKLQSAARRFNDTSRRAITEALPTCVIDPLVDVIVSYVAIPNDKYPKQLRLSGVGWRLKRSDTCRCVLDMPCKRCILTKRSNQRKNKMKRLRRAYVKRLARVTAKYSKKQQQKQRRCLQEQ